MIDRNSEFAFGEPERDLTQPPHNPQAESAVIGSVLKQPKAITRVTELRAQDFYQPRNGLVFEAMLSLHRDGDPIDYTSVDDRVRQLHPERSEDWLRMLSEVNLSTPTSAHIEHYAGIVQRCSVNRQLISAGADIMSFAYRDDLDPKAAMAKALSFLQGVIKPAGRSRLISPEEWASDTLDALEKYLTGGVAGVDLPWWEAARMVGPLEPTTVTLLGARLKSGKSSFAWQVADAAQSRGPVLYASQEMNAVRLGIRYIAAKTGVKRMAIRRGWVDRFDRQRMAEELERVAEDGKIWIYYAPGCTAEDVKNKALELAAQEGQLALVVEDYLQLLTDKVNDKSRGDQNVTYAFSRLQEMASEANCPVLCVAQLKRRENELVVPTMADFADSDGPARNADVLLAMHRVDAVVGVSGERARPGEMDLHLLASRDASWGAMAHATLRWEGEMYADNKPEPADERQAA